MKNSKEDKKKSKNVLNSTDKITLQYMTNPLYNSLVVDDEKKNDKNIKLLEKKEEIIFFKKNIINLTKRFLDSFEKGEKLKVPENIYESFNNYVYNLVGYIEHKKTVKYVKDELEDFDTSNNDYNNDKESINTEVNDKYINNIIQSKNNDNNLSKFIKVTNLTKKEKIIPNKKNIYK